MFNIIDAKWFYEQVSDMKNSKMEIENEIKGAILSGHKSVYFHCYSEEQEEYLRKFLSRTGFEYHFLLPSYTNHRTVEIYGWAKTN